LHLALAENAVRAGDLAGARKIYKDAMDLKALGEEGFIGIAKTYLLARPPDQSLALEYALKAATPHNTSSVDAYGLAGQIALAMKNFEGAEKYFTEALSLAPSSEEIVSRLSGLYERWSNEESIKGRLKEQIQHLTKSINLAPSVGKYFDRAFAQRRYFLKLGERQKAYELASGDFTSAREMASREDRLLTQFPWLMPNLAESLVFEGKFGSAKSVIQDLFLILGSESSMRTSIDRGDIRLIATFLNFVAEVLDAGSAEKELYLLENALLGRKFNRSSWSFAEMEAWLDKDYAKGGAELNPDERNQRVGAVRQVIGRIKVM